uniref:C2 domain-containing protein n=1 Tax=Erythrolobus australicus TaxID=1077150 RepID=A0A7S1TL19_9RHOD
MATNVNCRLHICIVSAFGLQNTDFGSLSDPYCRLTVDGQEIAKTHVVDNNLSPVWHTQVRLHLQGQVDPRAVVFNFSLYDKDKFTKDDFLGHYEMTLEEMLSAAAQGTHTYMLERRKHRRDKVTGSLTLEVTARDGAAAEDGDLKWHFQNARLRPGGLSSHAKTSIGSQIHDKIAALGSMSPRSK